MNADLRAALKEGDAGKALALIRQLTPAERDQFAIVAHEADLLGKLGRHDEELALLRRLIARGPPNPSLHLSCANALKILGCRDEAIAAAKRALAIRADYGKAWWLLADLKIYAFTDDEIAKMTAALIGARSEQDRLHLHFALGRAYEQGRKPGEAFPHYDQGNALAAAGLPPGAMQVTERVEGAITTFTPQFFAERQGFGDDSNAPVFIVGLHRSGSTLVEQILGCHSQIEATSELPIVIQLLRSLGHGGDPMANVSTLNAGQARALGKEYLARASHYRTTNKPHFIDKMPANWLHIGFIRLILPNATIIDARRHPMAAGFSNFRQNYGSGAAWSYSLDSIGRYYQDYLRLIRHFDRVLPGKIHRVINERLIEDFKPEVRRLLDDFGVPFEPAVLEFNLSNRPVRSASAEQVRRPINREGVDQWRAFEPWLGPLRKALGPALEDWQE